MSTPTTPPKVAVLNAMPSQAADIPGFEKLSDVERGELSEKYDILGVTDREGFSAWVRGERKKIPAGATVCPTPKDQTASLVLAWVRTLA